VFYSESSNEKEANHRICCLASDHGDGKKVYRTRPPRARKEMRRVRVCLCAFRDTAESGRRTMLGMPAFENQRLARLGPTNFGPGIGFADLPEQAVLLNSEPQHPVCT
jgi:hypothetical protein